MKKKLTLVFSLLAMIFSVNASVDPFHFSGHGAELLDDRLDHELYYVDSNIKHAVIKIKNPIEKKYRFYGSKKAVYNFASYLNSVLLFDMKKVTISKESNRYIGELYNEDFVSTLNAANSFLGIDLP